MQYFFILGSNPTLSLAELASVFYNTGTLSLIQTNIAILETNKKIAVDIIKKIGGTIKFGIIHGVGTVRESPLQQIVCFAKPETNEKKFMFGFSAYGKNKVNIKALAMEFKKSLKQSGVNSRWVISREPTLSSVVVEQNKLTTNRGVEIIVIEFNNKLLIGKTLAVQPFKKLSFRDYGRPARDDRSGMLPPKLAQIMINLAAGGNEPPAAFSIIDPFCGSGTIITEAMLMGYQNVAGADISQKAVADTEKNINWVREKFKILNFNFQLLISDARQIAEQLPPNSVDAIVTEPYLGPQRGPFDIDKTAKELEQLYSRSLSEFKKILKPGGRVVMVWPSFYAKRQNIFLTPDLAGFKIINPIPENLRSNIFIKLTNRNTIIYGREQQKIWREIIILEKNNHPR